MIAREDAKDGILEYYNVFRDLDWQIQDMLKEGVDNRIDEIYDSLEQHIKSLEAQLANTEQLTCETCSEFSIFNDLKQEMYHEDGICLHGMSCAQRVFKNYGCVLHTKDTK